MSKESPGIKIISTNSHAKRDFFVEEIVEAGMSLQGTEVKSLRAQAPSMQDSFVEVRSIKEGRSMEAWVLNLHIPEYSFGNHWNHDPVRPRKLLLHAHQIKKIFGAITQKGYTVIPLKIYFKNSRIKIEIGLAKGKKKADKRQSKEEKASQKEMRTAMKRTRA